MITTDQLRAVNDGEAGWLQLGPGVLDRLDPLGFHVLVPAGHLHIVDDTVMSCIAQLQTGAPGSLNIRVLVPHGAFLRLPRAVDVLALVPAIGPLLVESIEDWLDDFTTGDDDDAF